MTGDVDCTFFVAEDITPEHFAPAIAHYPAIFHILVGCGYLLDEFGRATHLFHQLSLRTTCKEYKMMQSNASFALQSTILLANHYIYVISCHVSWVTQLYKHKHFNSANIPDSTSHYTNTKQSTTVSKQNIH